MSAWLSSRSFAVPYERRSKLWKSFPSLVIVCISSADPP
jgi:hypothetical protein